MANRNPKRHGGMAAASDATKMKPANKAPDKTPDEVLARGAKTYAQQILAHGQEGAVEAVVILVSRRDGRLFWGSTLRENEVAAVVRAVSQKIDQGVIVVPADALPRTPHA